MECSEVISPAVALEIIQDVEKRLMREKLFECIYSLFQGSFLQWILKRYNRNQHTEKLRKDAEDAFQEGICAFYLKARKNEVTIKGSLKTTIYSFGLLQLLARFKKEKFKYEPLDYTDCFGLLLEEGIWEIQKPGTLDEREEEMMKALSKLSDKQREILSMKFFGKLKSKEIAEKLGVTAGDVDNNAAKAYKELRKMIKHTFSTQF